MYNQSLQTDANPNVSTERRALSSIDNEVKSPRHQQYNAQKCSEYKQQAPDMYKLHVDINIETGNSEDWPLSSENCGA
jgi:hypothetical protein